jgi:hypothetical protein
MPTTNTARTIGLAPVTTIESLATGCRFEFNAAGDDFMVYSRSNHGAIVVAIAKDPALVRTREDGVLEVNVGRARGFRTRWASAWN